MDAYEATRIVFARIQSLEPENVSKIMGYLLLLDQSEQEMIRLAFGPDTLLLAVISKAKKDLESIAPSFTVASGPSYLSQLPMQISQFNSSSSRAVPTFASLPAISPLPHQHHSVYSWPGSHSTQQERPLPLSLTLPASVHPDQQQLRHSNLLNVPEEQSSYLLNYSRPPQISANEKLPHSYHMRDQLSFFNDASNSMSAFPNDYFYPEMLRYLNGTCKLNGIDQLSSIANVNGDQHRPSSIADLSESALAWKPCIYFSRGFCKHGSNCRFLHGYVRQESVLPALSSGSPTEGRTSSSEEVLQAGSLERLELELQELLRGKKAPVSIAALPQHYYERFGKTLQAEGYLTESQRHGKAGYSLTKLLARLRNTVTLIDRPHGQHAVVLAEDAHRFTAYRTERDDLGGVNPGSRQIYLTFPAESTFTEEDVSNYFRTYGPVQDVRIPYQQKRMFGFVTFVYPETVKTILAKGNPHYVCGARVLVKPYREKGKVGDRKYSERGEHSRCGTANNFDIKNYDIHSAPRFFDNSELIRRHIEEQEQTIELERRRLSELHLVDAQRACFGAEHQISSAASTTQIVSHALVQNQFANGLVHNSELEESKASEDLTNFPATDAFGYLLDVLDNGEEEPKHIADQESYGQNLPESPFASVIGSKGNDIPLSSSEKTMNITMTAAPKTITPSVSVMNKELTCSMCLDATANPCVHFECKHAFCAKCISKADKMPKDECPICVQHKFNQVVKLSESRDLHDFSGMRVMSTSNVW